MGEKFLRPGNQPAVELVEIEFVAQQLQVLQGFSGSIAVKSNRQPGSRYQGDDRKRGNNDCNFPFHWECEELSRKERKSTKSRQERERD